MRRLRALLAGPIARGATLSLGIRLTGIAASFVQAIVAARLLGTEQYGVAAVVLSTATILGTLSALGLGQLAVREIARLRAREGWGALRGFVGASFVAVVATGFVAGGSLWLTALLLPSFDPAYRAAFACGAGMVLTISLIRLQRGIAQGLGRILSAQAPDEVVRPLLLLVCLGGVALLGAPLRAETYLLIVTLAAGLALATGLVALRRALRAAVPAAAPLRETRRWAGEALPFLEIAVLAVLLAEANTLMLGLLADPREAALYQPLARLTPLMMLGMQAVAMPFSPRVGALWSQNETTRLAAVTRLVTLSTTAVTVAIAAVLLAAAPTILAAFGPDFVAVAPALWWLAAAQCLNAACGPVAQLLTMADRAEAALRAQLLALAALLALGLVLIPPMGAEGAAIALAASITAWNLAMLHDVRRGLGFDPSLWAALASWSREGRSVR